MLRIKKENQRPGQSIKVLLKEVIQLPVSVVCRDYTNVLMAFRACWMGSDPALVRMGPRCTWSFSVRGPHQCEVYTTAPLCVTQGANRGEPLGVDLISQKHRQWPAVADVSASCIRTAIDNMSVFKHQAGIEYVLNILIVFASIIVFWYMFCFFKISFCQSHSFLKDKWSIFLPWLRGQQSHLANIHNSPNHEFNTSVFRKKFSSSCHTEHVLL